MKLLQMVIPGCYEIFREPYSDDRGLFSKIYNQSGFADVGLESNFVESFLNISKENVLRGMHFQLPPYDHAKLVYCANGMVMDVCLDLRRGSPTYGCYVAIELGILGHNAIYLPRGVAHGFYVRKGPATIIYHVTSEYRSELDAGVAWDSFGAPWPFEAPIISPRDALLPRFEHFDSPFQYTKDSRKTG
jgi:dTDP-4-dehydrorhamnose 3,5-epimerase